jgi:hypothetical protein
MPVPPNVEAAFRKSLQDTINYYERIKTAVTPYTGELAALAVAMSLPIGDPGGKAGVNLASAYYKAVKDGRIRRNTRSMSSSQRAVSNALDLLTLVNSKSHPQSGRISQLKAALNTPLPQSSTNSTLSQRKSRLRLSQKRSNALKSNRGPVPYNIREYNGRRRTNGRSTFAPRVGSRLAANARRQLAGEPAQQTALEEANDAALRFLRNQD